MLGKILDWFGFGAKGHAAPGGHGHHGHDEGHGHTHGVVDPTIATTSEGIRALLWSFVILGLTAVMQLVAVYYSGSVALLADTIHNLGDAGTAIPLWIAFLLARRPASKVFNYGLGRVEDLAGIIIVVIILISAIVAGYESINHLLNPRPIAHLEWLVAAGVLGFIGNEVVAVIRIRAGRRINSAALIADGYHARTDGLTSLAVVAGAIGVWLGFPLADPIVGLIITALIFGIVWQSAKSVFTRILDGIEPGLLEEINHAAIHVEGINRVVSARARWIGHRLHVHIAIALDEGLLLSTAQSIAQQLRQALHAHLPALAEATVTFADLGGEVAGQHHPPDPVVIRSKLAEGILRIVDTPQGERMELRVSRQADGLNAIVDIDRGSAGHEVLELSPVAGDHRNLQSANAPAEPHEFTAKLRLTAGDETEEIAFAMAEPVDHPH